MKRLAILTAAALLAGCESPTAIVPPTYVDPPGAMDGLQCVKFRVWPSTMDSAGQFDFCEDGTHAQVVAARWTPKKYGVCTRDPTGDDIRGGLQAVEYVYGCRK